MITDNNTSLVDRAAWLYSHSLKLKTQVNTGTGLSVQDLPQYEPQLNDTKYTQLFSTVPGTQGV